MTQSYLSPPLRNIDKVRLLIGETDITDDVSNIEDEEIGFFLDEEANIYMASSMAALAVARKLQSGGLEDLKVGETRLRTKRVAELEALANRLRDRGSAYKLPSAGGIYISDSRTADAAEGVTIEKHEFKIGMNDFPAVDPRDGTESS